MKAIGRLMAWVGVVGLLVGGVRVEAIDFAISSGDWNDTNSWSPKQLPTSADNVNVINGGTAIISSLATGNLVIVGVSATPGTGNLIITNGAEFHIYQLYNRGSAVQYGGNVICDVGAITKRFRAAYGGATYTQLGGTVTAEIGHLGQEGSSSLTSTYTLVSDTATFTTEFEIGDGSGSKGRFVQYGGTLNGGNCEVGYTLTPGYYDQYGGTNSCYEVRVGNNGTTAIGYYTITNGRMNVAGAISLGWHNGATGTMVVSGSAIVDTPAMSVGRGDSGTSSNCMGTLTQNGGTVTVSGGMTLGEGIAGVGRYTLGGGTLTVPILSVGNGARSDGIFTQTGGVLNVASAIYLAGSATTRNATMLTQGGAASIATMAVGNANSTAVTSRWNIAGGAVTVNNLYAGFGSGDATVIDLSGGSLTVTNLQLGRAGGGMHTFTQSGGTNTVVAECKFGRNGGALLGAYHITGGQLICMPTMEVGAVGSSTCTGVLHVAGMAPQVQAGAYNQTAISTLEVTLEQNGGMRPIAVSGGANLAGALTVGRTNNALFEPGMVVTVMTYSSRSGVFAQTNFLNDMTCRVNYGATAITLDQLQPVLIRGTCVSIR